MTSGLSSGWHSSHAWDSRHGGALPPPTSVTISTASPACKRWSAWRALGTTSRLTSTATRRRSIAEVLQQFLDGKSGAANSSWRRLRVISTGDARSCPCSVFKARQGGSRLPSVNVQYPGMPANIRSSSPAWLIRAGHSPSASGADMQSLLCLGCPVPFIHLCFPIKSCPRTTSPTPRYPPWSFRPATRRRGTSP